MSNGDDAEGEDDATDDADSPVVSFEQRLDDAAEALDAAETEADLDDVEDTLDDIAGDIETADLPEPEPPEDEDEEPEDPAEELEERLSDLRDDLEDQRGPYLEDVTDAIEGPESTLADTRWTEEGEPDAVAAAVTFAEDAGDVLGESFSVDADDAEGAAEDLGAIRESIGETGLDPDDDAETIADLLEAVEDLEDGLEAAEEWDDLTIREQFEIEGFYDVLTPLNRKDYPAEWNAIRIYEKMGEPEPIVKALETFDSDFMEENSLDALEHIAPAEAYDAVLALAQRRNKQPVRILGRIGDERACETLHDFLDGGDVELEKVTLRALGSIGSEESVQPVANRLAAENPEIQSVAARALGLIGDTRAIEPLADVLESDDADEVRASAAWALNQIGTERALDAAAEYTDDRSYIVQVEAERAASV